jgi:hypothetical protein
MTKLGESLRNLEWLSATLAQTYPLFRIYVLHSAHIDTQTKDKLIKDFGKIVMTVYDAHQRAVGEVPSTPDQKKVAKKDYDAWLKKRQQGWDDLQRRK